VGVVRNTKYSDLRDDLGPIVYFADTQDADPPGPSLTMLVRTAAGQVPTEPILRAVHKAAPGAVVTVGRLDDRIDATFQRERLMATLSSFFGVLAAVLAAVGLYGVMSYLVARRRTEIGIRLALGATRLRIMRLVLTESTGLVAVGLALGLLLTMAAGRAVGALLFGLTATNPWILALAAAGLALTAVLATAIPARRASRLSPTTALRED
jgi:putative ABC transport system permease protein